MQWRVCFYSPLSTCVGQQEAQGGRLGESLFAAATEGAGGHRLLWSNQRGRAGDRADFVRGGPGTTARPPACQAPILGTQVRTAHARHGPLGSTANGPGNRQPSAEDGCGFTRSDAPNVTLARSGRAVREKQRTPETTGCEATVRRCNGYHQIAERKKEKGKKEKRACRKRRRCHASIVTAKRASCRVSRSRSLSPLFIKVSDCPILALT